MSNMEVYVVNQHFPLHQHKKVIQCHQKVKSGILEYSEKNNKQNNKQRKQSLNNQGYEAETTPE